MKIDFTELQLKYIYADLLGISSLAMPEDKMKILMKIRDVLKWNEQHLTEEI